MDVGVVLLIRTGFRGWWLRSKPCAGFNWDKFTEFMLEAPFIPKVKSKKDLMVQ